MREGLQRVAIEGLTVEMSVGIADWERVPGKKQRVTFDVAVYRALFGQEATIADCYDYAGLQAYLAAFAGRPHIDLLESMLTEVLSHCFGDPAVVAAEVKIAKPDVFNGLGVPSVAASVNRAEWAALRP